MTEQGAIARVTRADLSVLSMDVPLDLSQVQLAWPEVYSRIGAAFDALFEQADHDPDRPVIEFYRREDEIDCLVPVRPSQ